jgi:hypothetical protein
MVYLSSSGREHSELLPSLHALQAPDDPGTLAMSAALAYTGGGDGGNRSISSSLKAGANLDFGAVSTQPVDLDIMALRRKLAGQ